MAREGSDRGSSRWNQGTSRSRPLRSGPSSDRPCRSRDSSGPRSDRPFREGEGGSYREDRPAGRPFRSRDSSGPSSDRPFREGPDGDGWRRRDSREWGGVGNRSELSGPGNDHGLSRDEVEMDLQPVDTERKEDVETPVIIEKASKADVQLPHIRIGRSEVRGTVRMPKHAESEAKSRPRRQVGEIAEGELGSAVPSRMVPLARKALKQAGEAYERDRYEDALRLARKLDSLVPDIPANLELLGLTQYRMGRYESALRTLRKHFKLTDDPSQMPVMMDCARALGKNVELEHWWSLLRAASPSREIVTEGRIVYCGFLADSEQFDKAEALLKQAVTRELNPAKLSAIRQKYLLGMVYERQGDIAQAREVYSEILRVDRGAYDIAERLAGLN